MRYVPRTISIAPPMRSVLCKGLSPPSAGAGRSLHLHQMVRQSASRFTAPLIYSTHSGISLPSGSAQSATSLQASSFPPALPVPTFSPHLPQVLLYRAQDLPTWQPVSPPPVTWRLSLWPLTSYAKPSSAPKNDVKEKAGDPARSRGDSEETHTHTVTPSFLPFVSWAPPQIRAVLDGMGRTVSSPLTSSLLVTLLSGLMGRHTRAFYVDPCCWDTLMFPSLVIHLSSTRRMNPVHQKTQNASERPGSVWRALGLMARSSPRTRIAGRFGVRRVQLEALGEPEASEAMSFLHGVYTLETQ